MEWADYLGEPNPVSAGEIICIIIFASSFMYTLDYPTANGLTILSGLILMGANKLIVFVKEKI